jgi:hypothetical protein
MIKNTNKPCTEIKKEDMQSDMMKKKDMNDMMNGKKKPMM